MATKLIRRADSPNWFVRGTVCGASVYHSTKLANKRLAERYRARITKELEDAHIMGAQKPQTFDEACAAYLDAGGSDRFLPRLRQSLGKRMLRDISQPELDKAAKKIHPTAQPATLNRQVYTPFIAVWNFAAENDWARVRKWRRPVRRSATCAAQTVHRCGTSPVEYDHAARFVAAMSPDPAMLMTFLFYTGLRPIEAFALRAEDVSIEKQWFVVRSSKTGQPRGVPLHSFLCGWLPALVERGLGTEDGALFRTPRGKPYEAVIKPDDEEGGGGGLKTAIKGARRRSGIKDVSPYTARHTVSTGLVVAGVHPHIKDQILGHAADDMSRHYTNVPQAPLIEAINRLPVPETWKAIEWTRAPADWFGKLAEGTGKRTDLGK